MRAEEPVVEDGEQDNSEAGEQDENENDRASRQLSDDQLVKAFVRYVLTCEHSRTVIRRDAINQRSV